MWSSAEEIIAFTIALALHRHVVHHKNQNDQFSASDLAAEVNYMPFSDQADLHVDTVALQQGIVVFKKAIKKQYSPEFIQMNPTDKDVPTVPSIYGLDSYLAGFNIKFSLISALETKSAILQIRNKILKLQAKGKAHVHNSLSSARGQYHS
jgi:hypothetical protein